jgi:RNA polymerase sigma-70 factor, ECF subfamily
MPIVSLLGADAEAELLLAVHSIARQRLRKILDEPSAEDIAQDVVLEILGRQRAGTLRLRRQTLVALVRRRAFDRAKNLLRWTKRQSQRDAEFQREIADSVHQWMSPDVALEAEELEAVAERTLETLSPDCRRPYRMVREEKRSYRDVATDLGITRSTVCDHLSEAQNRFRDALRDHGLNVPAAMASRPTHEAEKRCAGGTTASGTTPHRREG